ncbi:peptide ABC transporter substrate-binding protein [bacterium]|nr:peptide ABC transporter substrate-binding protein [bacterium]
MNSFNKKIFWFKKVKIKLADFIDYLKNKFSKKEKNNHFDWDRKLVGSLSKSKIPSFKQIKHVKNFLTPRELLIVKVLIFIVVLNIGFLFYNFYQNNLEMVPKQEGTYVEGLVGSPQYINPLYSSINDVDGDIGSLIFSSLFRINKDGMLEEDLVKEYQINDAKNEFTLTLKNSVKWHSGEDLSVDDIVFTFSAIQDERYNSPLRTKFLNIQIQKEDENKVKFYLPNKNADFLSELRFGIIPKFLWDQIMPGSAKLAELNLKPIGSGPYKFKSLIKDKFGNILDYKLEINKEYYEKEPYIENLEFKFFVSPEEAVESLNTDKIDGLGYLPEAYLSDLVAKDSLNIEKLKLPKINSIFLNKNKNITLKDLDVRKALALSINRERIVSEVFGSGAKTVKTPLPSFSYFYTEDIEDYSFDLKRSEEILEERGWLRKEINQEEIGEIKKIQEEKKEEEDAELLSDKQRRILLLGPGKWRYNKEAEEDNYLIIELTYPSTDEYQRVAQLVKGYWEEIGVKTILRPIEVKEIYSQVILNRNFQALIYAQAFELIPDLYSFWHSSQIEEGLNISSYNNEKVDQLLKDAQNFNSYSDEKRNNYIEAEKNISQDVPVIFMYSPYYNYIQSKKIKGFNQDSIYKPSNRFSGIFDWYVKVGKKIKW